MRLAGELRLCGVLKGADGQRLEFVAAGEMTFRHLKKKPHRRLRAAKSTYRNRWQHGGRSAETLALRKEANDLCRAARATIAKLAE